MSPRSPIPLGQLAAAFLLAALVSGCLEVDPELEAALRPEMEAPPPEDGLPLSGGAVVRPYNSAPMPDWNPNDRIPSNNPRVLTNDVYGPGRSSDVYGRMILHNPGLQIEESSLGAGDYRDQYGRPVRCYNAGTDTFCQ